MLTSKNSRLVFFVLAVLTSVTILRVWFPSYPNSDHLLDYSPEAYWINKAQHALSLLGATEEFVTINPRKETWGIRIFLFDSEISDTFVSKYNSRLCAYLGDGKTIICDIAMVRFLSKHLELSKSVEKVVEPMSISGDYYYSHRIEFGEELSSEEYENNILYLLTWVLGHEIGHLLAGHKGAFHFNDSSVQRLTGRLDILEMIEDMESQRLETEADTFLVSLIDKSEVGTLVEFLELSQDRLNAGKEYRCSMGNASDYRCSSEGRPRPADLMEFLETKTGSHPRVPDRLSNMSRLAKIIKTLQQSPSFKELAEAKFK